MKYRRVFTSSDFDLGLRIRFVKCYVWPVLLHGMEDTKGVHYEQD